MSATAADRISEQVLDYLHTLCNSFQDLYNREIYTMLVDSEGMEAGAYVLTILDDISEERSEIPATEELHEKLTVMSNFSLAAFKNLDENMRGIIKGRYDLHLVHWEKLYYETIDDSPPEDSKAQFSQCYQLKKSIEKGSLQSYLGEKYAILQDRRDKPPIVMITENIDQRASQRIFESIKSNFDHERMVAEGIISSHDNFQYCTYFAGELNGGFRPAIMYETDSAIILFGAVSEGVYATFLTNNATS